MISWLYHFRCFYAYSIIKYLIFLLKGCVYQGMCQEFDSTWKDFRGAELKCKKDEKRGFKIETIKAGKIFPFWYLYLQYWNIVE